MTALLLGTAMRIPGAEWIAIAGPNNTSIEYRAQRDPARRGHSSLNRALAELFSKNRVFALSEISAHDLSNEAGFRGELDAALEGSAPGARKSTGAVPDVAAFEKAVLSTPTIRKLNSTLSAFGLQVSGVSVKKLSIKKGEDGPVFTCTSLLLTVGQIFRPAVSHVPYK